MEAVQAAVSKRNSELGLRAPGVRDLTKALANAGVEASEDQVARCIKGEVVTWDIALPLSKLLDIPPPAAIAKTMNEGQVLADVDEVASLLERLRGLRIKL